GNGRHSRARPRRRRRSRHATPPGSRPSRTSATARCSRTRGRAARGRHPDRSRRKRRQPRAEVLPPRSAGHPRSPSSSPSGYSAYRESATLSHWLPLGEVLRRRRSTSGRRPRAVLRRSGLRAPRDVDGKPARTAAAEGPRHPRGGTSASSRRSTPSTPRRATRAQAPPRIAPQAPGAVARPSVARGSRRRTPARAPRERVPREAPCSRLTPGGSVSDRRPRRRGGRGTRRSKAACGQPGPPEIAANRTVWLSWPSAPPHQSNCDSLASFEGALTRNRDRERARPVERGAEHARGVGSPHGFKKPCDRALEGMLAAACIHLATVRNASKRELGVERDSQGCLGCKHIKRVDTRESAPRPGHGDRAECTAEKMEDKRRRVLDVATVALTLRESNL